MSNHIRRLRRKISPGRDQMTIHKGMRDASHKYVWARNIWHRFKRFLGFAVVAIMATSANSATNTALTYPWLTLKSSGTSIGNISVLDCGTGVSCSRSGIKGTLVSSGVFSDSLQVGNGISISSMGVVQTFGPGTGSISGNARGIGATDLQTSRSNATMVASGYYDSILGGYDNSSSGGTCTVSGAGNNCVGQAGTLFGSNNYSDGYLGAIPGGDSNQCRGDVNTGITADYCFIGGGYNNVVSSPSAVIGGGNDNINAGLYCVISGGQLNACYGQNAFIAGGSSNVVYKAGTNATISGGNAGNIGTTSQNAGAATYAILLGGQSNQATGQYSAAGGRRAKSRANGAWTINDSTNQDLINGTTNGLLLNFAGGFKVQSGSVTYVVNRTTPIFISTMGFVSVGEIDPVARLDVVTSSTGSIYTVSISSQDDTHSIFNINSNGSVAIGTGTTNLPDKLTVVGSANIQSATISSETVTQNLNVTGGSGINVTYGVVSATSTSQNEVVVQTITAGHFVSSNTIETDYAAIFATGTVAINNYTLKHSSIGACNGSMTVYASSGSASTISLVGNCTISFANFKDEMCHVIYLKQIPGSKTVTWPTVYWPAGTPVTLTTTAGRTDKIGVCLHLGVYEMSVLGLNYAFP